MYYKVSKDGRIVDVLDRLIFVKYQKKHNTMLFCNKSEAQAIASSDGLHFWHVDGLCHMSVDGHDTVEVIPIDKYEYEQLVMLNMKTPEEIIDAYTLLLINGGVL